MAGNRLTGSIPAKVPSSLKKLNVKNNSKKFKITQEQVKVVKKQAPDCRVTYAAARRFSLMGADENG